MKEDQKIRFLLSFLMILVHRNGGNLKIENLSDYSNRQITLDMKIQLDSVVLTTTEIKH